MVASSPVVTTFLQQNDNEVNDYHFKEMKEWENTKLDAEACFGY